MATLNGTISTISPIPAPGPYYALVAALGATAFIQINDLDGVNPLFVSWLDPLTVSSLGAASNCVRVSGSVTVNGVENSPALWPLVNNSGLTIFGQFGQQFAINYA
jgi:hypothetical protein